MNSKGDSASPWKIPLWIFISAKLLPPAVSSTLQVFMFFSIKFMTSCDILWYFVHFDYYYHYYYYYYYYYYSLIRTFHISDSRWFFTGVRVTASLLKSSGLFLVFWPFSVMLSFGWSPLVRQLPSPPVPLVIL